MFPANITRAEAQERAKLIKTHSYQVTLDFSGNTPDPEKQFFSTSIINFSGIAAGKTHLDFIADELSAIKLDGVELPTSDFTGERYPLEITVGEHTLEVSGFCRYSRTGEGLHRFIDPADNCTYLYTQFETADSRRAYAVFEQPNLKAEFSFSVIAPSTWKVFSNSPTPAAQDLGNGISRWDFAKTKRISSYITAICAGDFHVVEDTYNAKQEIPLCIAVRKSLAEYLDADRIFTTTKEGFDVFLDIFDTPYPFDDYAQIFVPEFNFGAMENAGCVTFRDEYIFRSKVTKASYEARDNTILHEMAHMWFGDLVTMKWWDDLWLNESFAEFASHFVQEQIAKRGGTASEPWVTFSNQRKAWAYRQDQLPSTHPIAADMVDLEAVEHNFDGITYAKGASTLRQLVAAVGQEEFLAGVRKYFKKHAFSNTELRDLLVELESASGRNLDYFVSDWLGETGVNTLSPEFTLAADGSYQSFAVKQSANPQHPTLRKHRLGIGCYNLEAGKLVNTKSFLTDIAGENTTIPELVGIPQPDLLLLNDGDFTYAKIRLDDRSLKTLLSHIQDISDPLARALCWAAAWDMFRDAEMSAADFLDLIIQGIGYETDLTGVRSLINRAETAIGWYCAPELRQELKQKWHAATATLLAKAESGSDYQLAFAQALVSSADLHTTALLESWLANKDIPAGLQIDADLRWRIIQVLSRLGVYGETEIAAELAKDATVTGQEKAMGARATRPDATAKATAWQQLVIEDETPNATHEQGCLGFWAFNQEDVLAPYVSKYLEAVSDIAHGKHGWDRRSATIRNNVLGLLYPRTLADTKFVADLEQWLSENELPSGILRVVAECLDETKRALRCQKRSLQG